MNRNQAEGRADEAKKKDVDGEDETVLGEINDDSEKHDTKDGAKPGSNNGDAKKHGNKDGTVLGEVNDDDNEGK